MNIGFYVSIIRSPSQKGLLLGPYRTKETAELMVKLGTDLACHADKWAVFDAFGVTKVETQNSLPKAVFGRV